MSKYHIIRFDFLAFLRLSAFVHLELEVQVMDEERHQAEPDVAGKVVKVVNQLPPLLVILNSSIACLDLQLLVEDLRQDFAHLPVGEPTDAIEEGIGRRVLTKVISVIKIP